MNITELHRKLNNLNNDITSILTGIDYRYAEVLYDDQVEYNPNNPNDRLLKDEFEDMLLHLQEISWKLEYLKKDIIGEYILHLNQNDRYECSVMEYHCGVTIEFYYYDDWDDCFKWVVSRVEHKNGSYYIVGYDNVVMDGLKVRIRR